MISLKPLAITARCRINATYSITHTEVTIRRILIEIENLLGEYHAGNRLHTAECPLHAIREQLIVLRSGVHGGVFGNLCNAAQAVPYEELKPIIDLLPRKMYDTRYCPKYHVLIAGVHAAVIDMLAVDEIVQEPIIFVPSYSYIWSNDTVEQVDDIYFSIARYVGVSASTSGLARRMYLNQLNQIRKNKAWGEAVIALIMILASRVSIDTDFDMLDKFFGNLHCYPEARREYTVLEALLNLDHYYNGTNCTVFADALHRYCTYFAITDEERKQEGFMLNAI